MTQAKHTHGEWYARAPRTYARTEDGDTPTYTWTVRTKYEEKKGGQVGHEICEITHLNTGHEVADASLIAAAPKMYELLKRYYQETPIGNQPHMIAHEVEELLSQIEGA